jgi:arginyl-tRNA synthetase
MPSHHTPLHAAAAQVVASFAGVAPTDLKVEQPPRPELGDLAIGCFAIAKAKQQSPAQVANDIAAAFQPTELLESATAAGPFVNFRANRAAAQRWLVDAALTGTLLPRALGAGQTICIDYGSPNIAKHLAYHHIRGTTIGHALAQTFRALGYRVVGINFLGDWGTTHGMLLAAWHKWGAIDPIDVTGLNALYVKFREGAKADPALEQEGRAWFKRLESGEPEVRALWEKFREVSWAEFESVYALLGIEYDEVRGESAYESDMPRVLKELAPLLIESEGAQVVELEGEKTPILMMTKDGTTLYATRDVAAAEYRWATFQFTRSLYVVDRGQALHFRQLFKLLAKMGHEWAARCQHVPYGLVRLGGKKTSTRLGNVVLMKQVFDIAADEVRERIATKNPELSPAQIEQTARDVGIGAVIFANLASQREKDVDFDLDKAVSIEGDSGPYLQYSHARCASLARKAGEVITSADGVDFAKLATDAEWAVARRLYEFPDAVVRASDACEPHVIAHYLLELAADYSRWYTMGNDDAAQRVLSDDPATRRARLALAAAVQRVLREGLALLGIVAPDQM